MYGPVKAIAIDDEPAHLLAITSALGAVGISATGFWYDRESSALQPTPPLHGLSHLRIVFTDLNLAELAGVPDTGSLWATIVSVLKQVIAKDSGPYLLVFWTRIEANAAAVKEMLYQRSDQLGVPLPIDVIEMAKGPFLVKPVEGDTFESQLRSYYSELHSKMDAFKDVIEASVNSDKRVRAVAAWEARAAEAASRAVNEVARCARIEAQGDSSDAGRSIALTLSRIAVAASGLNAAKEYPARALDAGLIDIATDQFGASVADEAYQQIVQDCIAGDVETKFSKPKEMYAELNTFFHVDRTLDHVSALDRGAVVYVSSVQNLGGFNPMNYLTSEFVFPKEDVKKSMADGHQADIEEIMGAKSAVFVELGADCDHAQATSRTRRFLLAFCIPEKYFYMIKPSSNLRNGALELLGPWMIDGEMKHLLVSCRRFWVWQESSIADAEVAFRLRSSVVEKLLHRYAGWTSRPGVVEFR